MDRDKELKELFKKADMLFPYQKRREIISRICEKIYEIDNIEIPPKIQRVAAKVNRGYFVPEKYLNYAYEDTPLPLIKNQTISAIHMVLIMLTLLNIKKGQRILEIGTGSGYNATLLSHLVGKKGEIISIEYFDELYEYAKKRISLLNLGNVLLIKGDGKKGYPYKKPYDRIISTACAKEIYQAWKDQIDEKKGIILTPIYYSAFSQMLVKYIKREDRIETYFPVSFVPLL